MKIRFEQYELELDHVDGELRRDGKVVNVEPRVLALLIYLARRSGRTISRSELFEHVWSGTHVADSALSRAIKEARRAIGDDGSSQKWIETIRSRGFRLTGSSVRDSDNTLPKSAATTATALPFVGRQPALRIANQAIEEIQWGRGRLLTVMGEAGIGKSRLIQELMSRARMSGAGTHLGAALESDGATALRPWAQIIQSLTSGISAEDLNRLLLGTTQLANAFPNLASRLPESPASPPMDPEQARAQLFDETTALIRNCTNGEPTVLVFEDAHRSDTSSLRLLEFAAQQLSSAPILIVITYRDVEAAAHSERGPLLQSLAQLDAAGCIQLDGLSMREVGDLSLAIVGEPIPDNRIRELHRTTGGNPLFVCQVASLPEAGARAASIGTTLRSAIEGHLHMLSATTRDILAAGAVLGREFDLSVLSSMLSESPLRIETELEPVLRARLASESGHGRFNFVHALVRDALYDSLTRAQRRSLHADAAAVIESQHSPTLGSHLAIIAHHQTEAALPGDVSVPIEWLRRAAECAIEQLASEEATELLQRALELDETAQSPDLERRCELRVRLAEALRICDATAALAAAIPAMDLCEHLARPADAIRVACALPTQYAAHQSRAWHEILDRGLAAVGDKDPAGRARLLALRIRGSLMARMPDAYRNDLDESVELARKLDDPTLLTHCLTSWIYHTGGPEGADLRRSALPELEEAANSTADGFTAGMAIAFAASCLLENGDAQRGRQLAARGLELLGMHRTVTRDLGLIFIANIDFRGGDLDAAEKTLETHITAHYADGTSPSLWPGCGLVAIRREQGRLDEILPLLDALPPQPALASARALAHACAGNHEPAQRILNSLRDGNFAAVESALPWAGTMVRLAETAAILGDRETAAELHAHLAPYEDRFGYLVGIDFGSSIARELGLLADTLGQAEKAADHLQRAIEVNESVGARYWAARNRLELGSVLYRSGQLEQAGQLFRETITAAEAMRLPLLTQESKSMLTQLSA